jgi:pyruvate,water dikinase
VGEARRTYPIRESGEAVHAKTVGTIRLIALEAGSRMVRDNDMESPQHVMFLTVDEITDWLSESTDVHELVRTRRGQDLWARGHSPEPSYGETAPMPAIDVFPPDVQRIMKAITLITTHDQLPADLAEGMDGVGASPGVHTGTVRIVYGPDDFEKVQPGDVLVAPITSSPWEVLFPHAGALVTEGGGLLSHPAIVAREYGLPAVVGCEGAMGRFYDGQLVRVDGVAGTVTAIEV